MLWLVFLRAVGVKRAVLQLLLLELSHWSSQALLRRSSSSPQQGSLSCGQSHPHQVLTVLMTSAGILLSYRTGRKKLVGMQPGGDSLLLHLLKPVCPAGIYS